jgi:hypothetical protein
LEHWSDVVFLVWQQITEGNPDSRKNLRYVHRGIIANSQTRRIVAKIAKDKLSWWRKTKQKIRPAKDDSALVPKWPGIVVQPGDDAYYALLASPNGHGVAWLLIQ